jgi:hypothetical protein
VAEGVRGGRPRSPEVELDRATAIRPRPHTRRAGDVIVIAGKGHEEGRSSHGRRLPFSDVEVVRAWLAAGRASRTHEFVGAVLAVGNMSHLKDAGLEQAVGADERLEPQP